MALRTRADNFSGYTTGIRSERIGEALGREVLIYEVNAWGGRLIGTCFAWVTGC